MIKSISFISFPREDIQKRNQGIPIHFLEQDLSTTNLTNLESSMKIKNNLLKKEMYKMETIFLRYKNQPTKQINLFFFFFWRGAVINSF